MVQLISSYLKGSEGRNMVVDLRFDDRFPNPPVVIFVHGFKGFKDWGHFPKVGEELAKTGFAFVSFNLSHNGTTVEEPTDFADLEAFGNNNYTKELFDMGQVINGVADGSLFPDVGIDRKRIFLLGHSRGGGMCIVKASEDERVKGLVTWASVGQLQRAKADMEQWEKAGVMYIPNARTNQQMPIYYQFVQDFEANRNRFDLEKCCGRISVPSLFIHGTGDTTVPVSDAEDLAEWTASGNTEIVEGAGHTFGGKHPFEEDELPADTKKALVATVRHFKRIS